MSRKNSLEEKRKRREAKKNKPPFTGRVQKWKAFLNKYGKLVYMPYFERTTEVEE